jgi:hypothetical protein
MVSKKSQEQKIRLSRKVIVRLIILGIIAVLAIVIPLVVKH